MSSYENKNSNISLHGKTLETKQKIYIQEDSHSMDIENGINSYNYEFSLDCLNVFENDAVTLPNKMKVKIVNGKREGEAILLSSDSIVLAILNYKNDKLEGLCSIMNKYGVKARDVYYQNGIAEGWFCEYQNYSISKMGFNRNGREFSELREHPDHPDYYEEIVISQVFSICKYSAEHRKDGLCTFYHNDKPTSVVRFENGIKKEKVYEFHNDEMIEYDRGVIVYRGGYKGNAIEGFSRDERSNVNNSIESNEDKSYQKLNEDVLEEYTATDKLLYRGGYSGSMDDGFVRSGSGLRFVYDRDCLREITKCKNGKPCWKWIEFENDKMVEFNKKGEKVYEGGYDGDIENGFVRAGKGKEYNAGNCVYWGEWRENKRNGMGKSYKDSMVYYDGNWKNGKPNGNGVLMNKLVVQYDGIWQNGLFDVKNGLCFDYEGELIIQNPHTIIQSLENRRQLSSMPSSQLTENPTPCNVYFYFYCFVYVHFPQILFPIVGEI